MKFDSQLLHKDILRRLNALKKPQRHLSDTKINISRSTLNRLSQNKPITLETFLKLLDWLDYDANRYIKNRIYKR